MSKTRLDSRIGYKPALLILPYRPIHCGHLSQVVSFDYRKRSDGGQVNSLASPANSHAHDFLRLASVFRSARCEDVMEERPLLQLFRCTLAQRCLQASTVPLLDERSTNRRDMPNPPR